jgi:polyhydroxybutyrate depolymerase
MYSAARSFHFQTLWPEAIIVYMQGLPTPSKIDPAGKLPGWQHFSGQVGDRDLKFFDAVLAALRKNYNVDDHRIFATGFSNGGAFTYCLWANRASVFAAVAPMAGLPWPTEPPTVPKPAFIVAGQADNLVPIQSQESMIALVRELDKAAASKPQPQNGGTTLYESSISAPVVTLIHPGGHELPAGATKLIVDFFREHPSPASSH